MELVVFDLDGTLLGADHRISAFTAATLKLLGSNNIAYTVATGRSLHSAQDIISDHGFRLPHIYINGVIVWDPGCESLSLGNFLSNTETEHVIRAAILHNLTPFVHCVTPDHRHFIFHPGIRHDFEQRLLDAFYSRLSVKVLALEKMPADAQITNISMLGPARAIDDIALSLASEKHLVSYSGIAMESKNLKWLDVHHSQASKGNALSQLREQLGISRVVCFGDSDNDLSMFEMADESYAPANAKDAIKAASTQVIGHHNEDGIAHFLRQRFNL